ncbi:MAG: potassium channel protein [Gemmatimonadetes bacterium]|nr:potassium channel protein [Gemmatimonadota bacterium]
MSEVDVPAAGWEEDLRQLRRRLAAAALFLVGLLIVGVIGYSSIDPSVSWVDALYMTVITLTTVGYGEIVDLSGHPGGRVFTMALLLFGMGGVVYFVSTTTAFVLEGALGHVFWRRRMQKEIARISGHLIVCGDGPTALYAAAELQSVGRSLVVICERPERLSRVRAELEGVPVLVGDPTADEILESAGIRRAAGLIACADSDKDNLVITLTARQMSSQLRIVARVTDVEQVQKLRKAGADAVVSPHHIGGLRMASELVRPTVVSFLDQMLRDRERNLRVDEVQLGESSAELGKVLGQVDFRPVSNALLLACRTTDGNWVYHPPPELPLTPGLTLILMGSPEDIEAVRRYLRAETAPPVPSAP